MVLGDDILLYVCIVSLPTKVFQEVRGKKNEYDELFISGSFTSLDQINDKILNILCWLGQIKNTCV